MDQPTGIGNVAWRRIEELFTRALELPAAGRPAFLAAECAGDAALRARLEALLDAHAAVHTGADTDFLRTLDADRAAALVGATPGAEAPGAAAEAPEAEQLPARIGRYRIERRLGRGGMGIVYLATDPALGRAVALKLLPAQLSTDPAANRRFVEEARSASALDHPHIATIYEIGETDDGRQYIAMAYYEGRTLRQLLSDGALPIDRAVAIAAQLAAALAAAHGRGIVHRDLKPENVLVTDSGTVRLLDFGIAKVAASDLTRTGAALGTAAYMSPEQTRGDAVDHRTDIWSLGVVLHEMLTGQRPFGGGNAVIYRIRNDAPPPLRAARPDAPAALQAIVDRCLAREPERRYASAAELEAALRAPDHAESAGGDGHPSNGLRARARLTALPVKLPATLRRRPRVAAGIAVVAGALALAGALTVARGMPRVTHATGWAADAFAERGWVIIADFEAPGDGDDAGYGGDAGGAGAYNGPGDGGDAADGGDAGGTGASNGTGGVGGPSEPRGVGVPGGPGGRDAGGSVSDVALAAREALAVDLAQSGFVNVFSRGQVAATLQRMGLPPTTPLVLPTALEVAERTGAGAVLSVVVTRLGSQYALSGRAIRPSDGAELFAVRTTAGADRLIEGVETLSREMRRRLGEERAAVRRSRPLPEVTTRSLEALKLYATAERAMLMRDHRLAASLAAAAVEADPGFAMAHTLAGVIANNQLRFADAVVHYTRAFELRHRLTDRERGHVEGLYHALYSIEPRRSADAYEMLLARYPDDLRAAINLGTVLSTWYNDQEGAHAAMSRITQDDPGWVYFGNGMHTAFATGRRAVADSLLLRAEAHGYDEVAARFRIGRAFALGEHRVAAAMCDSILAGPPRPSGVADDRELCGSMDIASGRLRSGVARLEAVARDYDEARRYRNLAHAAQALATAELLLGEPERAVARIASLVDRIPADSLLEPDRFITRTSLRLHAALLGRPDVAARIADQWPAFPEADHWFARVGEGLVDAAVALAADDGATALAIVRAAIPDGRVPAGWRIWDELLRGLAFDAMGQPDSAAVYFANAADPAFLAFEFTTKDRINLPLALRRLGEAEQARGNTAGAVRAWTRLLELWADADPELRQEIATVRDAVERSRAAPDGSRSGDRRP